MPSTYTVNLGIEKPATGEQSGTWGDTTNINFDILDQAINGCLSLTLASAGTSGSPNTLAISDGATSDGRNKWVEFVDGGDLGATAYVQLTPNDAEKIVFIRNSLSGSRSVILFQGTYDAGRDLEVPAGVDMVVKFSGGGATATTTDIFTKLRATEITTPTLTTDDLTAGTADINDGTVEAVIGGTTPKAGTFTNLTANTDLSLATGATVTGINTTTNMSDASATTLATSLSIKTYVDDQVATVDTLAEVLANGNTSGANNLIIDSGQALTANTINETTAGSGVTIDSVLLKDDGVNATNLEVTNIKANDGTAAGSIANSTGTVTITSFVSNSVDIGGGAIDGTNIGSSSAGSGAFTTLSATGNLTVDTDTLYVDSTNDRVGVGTTTVDSLLHLSNNDATAYSATATDGQVGVGPTIYLENPANSNTTVGGQIVFGMRSTEEQARIAATGGSAPAITFGTNDAEAMRIDSSQRVLIGLTSDLTGTGHKLQVNDDITIMTFDGTTTGADGIRFIKSRASSPGSNAIVADGDDVGFLDFRVDDGTDYGSRTAVITSSVDGTPGTNDTPGNLRFFTTADGASSVTERMRITNAGDIGIGETDPDGKLDISVSGSNSRIHTINPAGGVGNSQFGFKFRWGNSANSPEIGLLHGGSFADAGLYFDTMGTSVQTRAMTIDSSQRVLIGTTSARSTAGHTGYLQVEGSGSFSEATVSIVGNENNTNGSYLNFGKSRGTTAGSNTIVQNGDVSGQIQFTAADGTDMVSRIATITAKIDGAPGVNDTPGLLDFATTADGASDPTLRMRITSGGLIGLATTSPTQEVSVGGNIDLQSLSGGNATMRRIAWRNTNSTGYEVSNIQGYTGANIYEGQIAFQTKNSGGTMTEAMRIDSSQQVVISSTGNTRAMTQGGSIARLTIEGTSTSTGRPGAAAVLNVNLSSGPIYYLAKSRGAANNSNTIVQVDDFLGQLNWNGADGTQFVQAATISSRVDGAPGVADMPARIEFATTPDGLNSPTERMRITSQGIVEMYGNSSSTLYLKSSSPILAFTDTNSFPDANDRFQIRGTSSDGIAAGSMGFYDSSTDTTNTYFTIKDDGKIGILNSTPIAIGLQIGGDPSGTVAPSMSISLADGGGTNTSLAIRGGSPTIFFDQTGGGNGKFLMDDADIAFKSGSMQAEGSELVRIRHEGGITFNGDTAAANALDDYEEGTWTATAVSGISGVSSSTSNNRYTKIGNIVSVIGEMYDFTVQTADVLEIGGLPYAVGSNYESSCSILYNSINLDAGYTELVGYAKAGSAAMRLYEVGDNVAYSALRGNQMGSGSFIFQMTYHTT